MGSTASLLLLLEEGVGPFLPTSISNLKLWLDADDATTITIATGVSQWNDKSGNGNNAVQATGANQPTLTGIHSRTALRGDGINDFMTYPNLGLDGLNDVSVFLVLRVDSTTSGNDNPLAFGLGNEGRIETGGTGMPLSGQLSFQALGFESGAIVGTGFNTASVFSLTTNVVDWSTFVDGIVDENQNSSTAAWSTGAGDYGIFASATPNRHLKGDIAEIIIYDKELTTDERLLVEDYLITRWGTGSPSVQLITEDGNNLITEDGNNLFTE